MSKAAAFLFFFLPPCLLNLIKSNQKRFPKLEQINSQQKEKVSGSTNGKGIKNNQRWESGQSKFKYQVWLLGCILEVWGRVRTGLNAELGAGFNSGWDRKGLNAGFGYWGLF